MVARSPRFLDQCRMLRASSGSALGNQDHAEARLALHRAGVSISSLFERSCLDHRANVFQDAEGQSVLVIDWCAGKTSVATSEGSNGCGQIAVAGGDDSNVSENEFPLSP